MDRDQLGIDMLLDPEDVVDSDRPDEKVSPTSRPVDRHNGTASIEPHTQKRELTETALFLLLASKDPVRPVL